MSASSDRNCPCDAACASYKPVVAGGFTQDVYDLMTQGEAATKVDARLLDTYFTDEDQDSLLQATGPHGLAEALIPSSGPDADEAHDPEKEEHIATEALLRAFCQWLHGGGRRRQPR
jgi:hypothetical protein